MPDQTVNLGVPFPLPDDALVDYPALGASLANKIEQLADLHLLWDSVDAGVVLPVAQITTPSLPQTFKHLLIAWIAKTAYGSGGDLLGMRLNGGTSAYYDQWLRAAGTAVTAGSDNGAAGLRVGDMGGAGSRPQGFGGGLIVVPNYVADANTYKPVIAVGGGAGMIVAGGNYNNLLYGFYGGGGAIGNLTFYSLNGGNFAAGTRFSVFGVG